MGRWTPLVLMAGGLAILLGTLLGINFPMGRQTAQNPQDGNRTSSVLPANINVNSTNSGSNRGSAGNAPVAQSNANAQAGSSTTTAQANGSSAQSNTEQTQAQADSGSTTIEPVQPAASGDKPIRALW